MSGPAVRFMDATAKVVLARNRLVRSGQVYDHPIATQKSLLDLAVKKYNLHDVKLYALGSVRRGGNLPLMVNLPVVLYQGTLNHRTLIVVLPEQLGLFSPSVLEGTATSGGLEALKRGSHTKLASLIPFQELSLVDPKRLGWLRGAAGLVVALRHSSGQEFTINTFSRVLAEHIRQPVSR